MSGERDDRSMDLGGHIDELRGRIIKCVVILVIFAILAFINKEILTEVIFAPSKESFVTFRLLRDMLGSMALPQVSEFAPPPLVIINTQMSGQFNMHLSISLWAAIIATVPFMLLQVWLFVKPALSKEMIHSFRGGVFMVSILFFIGVGFGYFMISPLAINFLTTYELSSSITNMIAMSSYLSTVMNISLAGGVAFQLPFLVRVFAGIGFLSADMMRRYRRLAIALIVVASAILTPPDLFSQVLLAIPLLGLYEISIMIAKRYYPRA
ncbi:MAG: twin-arginine translocase subunit TatC [Rikenellaceae bacterium]